MEDRRPRRGLRAIAAVAAIAACGALTTSAALAHEAQERLSQRAAERSIGETVEPSGEGLYRVRVGGESLLTHGPDPAMPSERLATRGAGVLGLGGEERAPACATDYHQHVLVGYIAGSANRVGELAASVRAQIRRMNWVLNADAMESGGVTADYKVVCDEGGEVRVDSFASPSPAFEDIVRSAKAAGFDRPNADYTIFFDALEPNGGCGIGSYRVDQRLSAGNASNTGGGYGVTYQPCWFGTTPMHENAHNQGAVQYSSPQSTGTGGHCNQLHDVLCYSPDGGDRNQGPPRLDCLDRPHFDCGADDYFDPAPEPGEYLETNWNLGSPLNRFIAFGPPPSAELATSAGAPPAAAPPAESACAARSCAKRLRLGRRVRGVVSPANGLALYRVRVPRGKRNLEVRTAGDPVDLYVRRRAVPDGRHSDCRSLRSGRTQSCRVGRARSGAWFVGVGEPEGTEPVEFALRASARR